MPTTTPEIAPAPRTFFCASDPSCQPPGQGVGNKGKGVIQEIKL